ncbi:MAG: DUF1080 domain-containing protein [Verrucomicrobiae bacterium]|nr:DUF1080 domain-containing protein [Verrucomicrobiae bacterium]NNJ86384.1 DUF1080 domain-containing protein [Akkermansiaceae bacterium]
MKSLLLLLTLGWMLGSASLHANDNVLTDTEQKDGWINLFNGKDFTGWQIDKWNPKSISIENGAITCQGKPSMLYHTGKAKNAKNFHFIADVMTKQGANGGIFFHTKYQDKGWPVGHEAQINQTHSDPIKTGSIYIVKNHHKAPASDNQWFRYEIIVKGNTVETKVDGKTVVTYTEQADLKNRRKLSQGTFGIQAHDPGSVVLVKNIKVKLLP